MSIASLGEALPSYFRGLDNDRVARCEGRCDLLNRYEKGVIEWLWKECEEQRLYNEENW